MKSLKSVLMTIAALAILVSACAPAASIPTATPSATEFFDPFNPPTATPTETLIPITPSAKLAQVNVARDTSPSVPTEDLQALVRGNNAFAFDLYHSMSGEQSNMVFSPYSISLALAMAYAGARGETESQMAQVLHFDLSQEQLHPAFNKLSLELDEINESAGTEENQEAQLEVANSLWAQDSYPFRQEYLDTVALNYGTGVRLVDFINNYNPLRLEINTWVREQTKGKINGLLPDGALSGDTRMILVNAVYLKADWLHTFSSNMNHIAPFKLIDGKEVQVEAMSDELHLSYIDGDGYQGVGLPYAGQTAEMTILIPDKGAFAAFESTLGLAKLNEILNAMQSASVKLSLPKFTFESQFSLPTGLSALGMTDAFNSSFADFSGMTGKRDLFISDVIHKAFVAVDEEGTEAAATTSIRVIPELARPEPIELIIDRPFIFIIRDTVNGQILFIGRVLNPLE